MYVNLCFSAYDLVIPARGRALAKTDIQIALPDGCYGRVGKIRQKICVFQVT